jgi:hypothetical protein
MGKNSFVTETTSRNALEQILGSQQLRQAVDYYVQKVGTPEAELARSVLWLLHPWSATQRCFEIYKNSKNLETRRSAVELLRVVADKRVLPWIRVFLKDPDRDIPIWGIGILDQLVFAKLVEPREARKIIDLGQRHSNPAVRKAAKDIKRDLKRL